ncbi:MAG TPA: DnaJ domain-containing protein [Candidatus Limnocylindria bacterium]|nr:DnaJ domain-containing protein [Candidatus Limnocylindria bacterium]
MGTVLDPYATLGIPAGASRADAARAHRRLAKRFHPDLNPGPQAADRMRRINEAWRILSDPARRARNDAPRAAAWPQSHYAGRQRTAWASYGPRTSTTWAEWPESRRTTHGRVTRPVSPAPVEPSFGDHPAVVIGFGAALGVLLFIGSWLGSMAP